MVDQTTGGNQGGTPNTPQGGSAGDGGGQQPGADSNQQQQQQPGADDLNPAMQQRLSAENARRRVENQQLREQVSTLEQQLARLQDGGQGDRSPGGRSGETATLRREVDQLRNELNQERTARAKSEETARTAKLQQRLGQITGGLQLIDQESAGELLRSRTKVAEDGEVVFTVKVKDQAGIETEMEVPATADAVLKFKLLPAIFFPAKGRPGANQQPSDARDHTGAVLDLERAKNDFQYYNANRDKILAAERAQQG